MAPFTTLLQADAAAGPGSASTTGIPVSEMTGEPVWCQWKQLLGARNTPHPPSQGVQVMIEHIKDPKTQPAILDGARWSRRAVPVGLWLASP